MPVFGANVPANVSVSSKISVGTTVTSAITATGDDNITYALTSQTPDSTPKIFAVDPTSGLLTIASLSEPFEKSYSLVITYVNMFWFYSNTCNISMKMFHNKRGYSGDNKIVC